LIRYTRVVEYGHRIRAVYGCIWRKYGVFTVVYGQIRAVYMPYFSGNQAGVLRPYLYRTVYGVFTAKIRWPYMGVYSHILAVYGRISVVYMPYWHCIRYYVTSYLHELFVTEGAMTILSSFPPQMEQISFYFWINTYHWSCHSTNLNEKFFKYLK